MAPCCCGVGRESSHLTESLVLCFWQEARVFLRVVMPSCPLHLHRLPSNPVASRLTPSRQGRRGFIQNGVQPTPPELGDFEPQFPHVYDRGNDGISSQ